MYLLPISISQNLIEFLPRLLNQGYTGCKQSNGSLGVINFIKKLSSLNILTGATIGLDGRSVKLNPLPPPPSQFPSCFLYYGYIKKWVPLLVSPLRKLSLLSVLLGFCVVRNRSPFSKPSRYSVFLGFCSGPLCLL